MSKEDFCFDRDQPECPVPVAAELEVFSPRQGSSSFSRTAVEIEVSLGEQQFVDGTGFGFSLSFRKVIVSLKLSGCELEKGGRYERSLNEKDFKQFLNKEIETSRGGKTRGEIKTSKIVEAVFNALGLSFSANAEANAAIAREQKETTATRIAFKIVRYVPGHRWEIGHSDFGDPLSGSGILHGRYFGAPPDGAVGEEGAPLCFVVPKAKRKSFSITIELRARKSDCKYSPVGDVPKGWQERNAFIEKILVTKMLEECNRKSGHEPPAGEIILARSQVRVRRLDEPGIASV